MKKWMTLMILWASVSLLGCVSAPEQPIEVPESTIKDSVTQIDAIDITPIALPRGFEVDVKKYKDDEGREWILVAPKDLDKIKEAYISAEGNAKLVSELNEYNKLIAERANMIRDLAIMEEYRSAKLELRLEEERETAKEDRQSMNIDLWIWKLTAILSLAVGL